MSDKKAELMMAQMVLSLGAAAATGPVALVVVPSLTAVGAALDWLWSRETIKNYAEAREEQIKFEISKNIGFIVESFREKIADLSKQVCYGITVQEAVILIGQLQDQAMRAVTEEHMRLICAAIAGSIRPDIEVEAKARAARAIAQLQPSDILLLRELMENYKQQVDVDDAFGIRALAINMDALLQAGCLMMPRVFGKSSYEIDNGRRYRKDIVKITELGRVVLRFAETWEPQH
jgi:hypothetical protein